MSDPLLPCTEVDSSGAADAAVIWLHGLGADGNDFVPAIPHLGLPDGHRVRFVFPTAEPIAVTINGGFVMPAWYDIRDLDLGAKDRNDSAGLLRSIAQVRALVAREVARGIPPERIVLAGFSQGGAVAIELALTHPEPLAGLVALSTYLVDPERVATERSNANTALPILQCHGTLDPMVPVQSGEAARDTLIGMGYRVAWQDYPMEHEVCIEELRLIGRFVATALADAAQEPA